MALLGAEYASSDEDTNKTPPAEAPSHAIVPAPDVSIDVWSHRAAPHSPEVNLEQDPMRLQMMLANPTDTALTYNVRYDDISRAEQGPANPFKNTDGNALKRKNIMTGYAQEAVISDATFNTQHRTFQSRGYATDPTANGAYVGDITSVQRYGGKDIVQMRPSKEESAALRRKRQKIGNAGVVDGEGAYRGPWAKWSTDDEVYLEEAAVAGQELASDEEWVEEAIVPAKAEPMTKASTDYQDDLSTAETTEFHGSSLVDYQGRTYMHVPQDLDIDLKKEPGTQRNYIPKKLIHTWRSHTKAINALQFFPNSGHLLLSASADCKVKLWDVYHNRELLRTYSGHMKSVTDINFSPLGDQFLSGSFDRQVKVWDTEKGVCTARFNISAIPHVIRFNPSSDNPHEFLAGCSNKKIVQYDIRSGEMTQEYDHHLGPGK